MIKMIRGIIRIKIIRMVRILRMIKMIGGIIRIKRISMKSMIWMMKMIRIISIIVDMGSIQN